MSSKDTDNTTFYISITTGLLLTFSEILPFIDSIKSNGILHLISNFLIKRAGNTNSRTGVSQNVVVNNTPNNTPSSTVACTENDRLLNNTSVLNDVSKVIITSENIKFTFNSPNIKLDFNESV